MGVPFRDARRGKQWLTAPCTLCNIYYMDAKEPIADALRRAIVESGINFKALERKTGVLRQSLMKFARGEQCLRGDAYDKLAVFFKLELQPVKPKKKDG